TRRCRSSRPTVTSPWSRRWGGSSLRAGRAVTGASPTSRPRGRRRGRGGCRRRSRRSSRWRSRGVSFGPPYGEGAEGEEHGEGDGDAGERPGLRGDDERRGAYRHGGGPWLALERGEAFLRGGEAASREVEAVIRRGGALAPADLAGALVLKRRDGGLLAGDVVAELAARPLERAAGAGGATVERHA